eukprot:228171_1
MNIIELILNHFKNTPTTLRKFAISLTKKSKIVKEAIENTITNMQEKKLYEQALRKIEKNALQGNGQSLQVIYSILHNMSNQCVNSVKHSIDSVRILSCDSNGNITSKWVKKDKMPSLYPNADIRHKVVKIFFQLQPTLIYINNMDPNEPKPHSVSSSPAYALRTHTSIMATAPVASTVYPYSVLEAEKPLCVTPVYAASVDSHPVSNFSYSSITNMSISVVFYIMFFILINLLFSYFS